MVAILMMPAKLTILGLLKTKIFWNKGYDIIISVHDIINKFYHVTQITERWKNWKVILVQIQ